jgi:hypothetical protein
MGGGGGIMSFVRNCSNEIRDAPVQCLDYPLHPQKKYKLTSIQAPVQFLQRCLVIRSRRDTMRDIIRDASDSFFGVSPLRCVLFAVRNCLLVLLCRTHPTNFLTRYLPYPAYTNVVPSVRHTTFTLSCIQVV